MAPANGWEHFAQNGGKTRRAVSEHRAQRDSPGSTALLHAAQCGG